MSLAGSSLNVQLHQFEGPLGLLLYLIKKEEMNIFDINIQDITRQYLGHLQVMRELDLEMAGEFVAMAATLIQIKARMLLPQYNEAGEEIPVADPRRELVQRLLEYQKFQEASSRLDERPLLNRDLWSRGVREDLRVEDDSVELEENALFSLISTYRKVVRAMEKSVHKVRVKAQSIASRLAELRAQLLIGTRVRLHELLSVDEASARRRQLLITFLAMLELGKMGFVRLFQNEPMGELVVEPIRALEGDVLSRVEEYDSALASEVADSLTSDNSELADLPLFESDGAETAGIGSEEIPNGDAATDEEIAQAEAEEALV